MKLSRFIELLVEINNSTTEDPEVVIDREGLQDGFLEVIGLSRGIDPWVTPQSGDGFHHTVLLTVGDSVREYDYVGQDWEYEDLDDDPLGDHHGQNE